MHVRRRRRKTRPRRIPCGLKGRDHFRFGISGNLIEVGHSRAILNQKRLSPFDRIARDPIERAKAFLVENGSAVADLDQIAADAEAEMVAAFETARDAPWPGLAAAASDVQDVGAPL